MQSRMQFSQFWFSYKFALRHISMRRSHLFSKRSNSKSSNLHMLAKVFRVNSRFWFTSRFLDSQWSLNHLQFADVVKSISSLICLAIVSHRALRASRRSLSWESIDLKKSQKLFVFEFRSFRSCLICFVSTSFARSITHLERTSWFEEFSMFYLFARSSRSINSLSRLTLGESLIWESQKFLVLLIL